MQEEELIDWKALTVRKYLDISVVGNWTNHAMFAFGQVSGGHYSKQVKMIPVI